MSRSGRYARERESNRRTRPDLQSRTALLQSVDDQVGPRLVQQRENALPVADIQGPVPITGDFPVQVLQHSAGVTLRPEEHRTVIVVDPVDQESLASEEPANLRADQSAGAGYKYRWHVLSRLAFAGPCRSVR